MPQIAGRVGFRGKGAYDPNTTYTMLNVVTWTDGNSYFALDTTTGNPPSDTNHWQPLTEILMATLQNLGVVKPDGTSITIDANGVISASVNAGVASFNARTGAVVPASGDYNAGQITYDNTGGPITASTAQGAIDKLKDATLVGSYVTVSSFTTLCDAIAAKVASMQPYTIENMVVACSAVFSQMPLGGNFGVQVYKGGTNNYISAIFQGYHSCELKRLTYQSGEWVFKDIDASAKWRDMGTLEPTTTPQNAAYLGSGKIHEFLIAYGVKNNTQAYGGGTVVLPNNVAQESICCLPIYSNNSTTLQGVVTFFIDSVNSIRYNASKTGFLLHVYCR